MMRKQRDCVLGLVLLAMLCLVGCGGTSDSSQSGESDDATASQAASQAASRPAVATPEEIARAKKIIAAYTHVPESKINIGEVKWIDLTGDGSKTEFTASYRANDVSNLSAYSVSKDVTRRLYHLSKEYLSSFESYSLGEITYEGRTYLITGGIQGSGRFFSFDIYRWDGSGEIQNVYASITEEGDCGLMGGNMYMVDDAICITAPGIRWKLTCKDGKFGLENDAHRPVYPERGKNCHILRLDVPQSGEALAVRYDGRPFQFVKMKKERQFELARPIEIALGDSFLIEDNMGSPEGLRYFSDAPAQRDHGVFITITPRQAGDFIFTINDSYGPWYYVTFKVLPPKREKAKTVEEAALNFLCDYRWGGKGPSTDCDREKTLARWREKRSDKLLSPVCWAGDINGDGLADYVFDISWCHVKGEGYENFGGATGNIMWAVLAGEKDGGFRVVDDGTGTPPVFMETKHHGWNDYICGGVSGAYEGWQAYCAYDGKKYKPVWDARIVHHDHPASMRPTDFPKGILRYLVKKRFGVEGKPITVKEGWCFREDLDGDGREEYLLWVEKVEVDGKTLSLSGDAKRANLFLFTHKTRSFTPVYEAYHTGVIEFPREMGKGRYAVSVWEQGTNMWDKDQDRRRRRVVIENGRVVCKAACGDGVSTLLTPGYILTVMRPNAREGDVACNNCTYRGVSRRTGKSITLKGGTYRPYDPRKFPSQLRGYHFVNGDVTYDIRGDRLLVTQGDKVLIDEKGQWVE